MENGSYEARKQALIEEITAAFDGVGRENGITLHEAFAIDGNGGLEERAAARVHDAESRWQDVPGSAFLSNQDVFPFLDPKGFRYYIPALMIWHLRYVDTEGPERNSYVIESVDTTLILRDGSLRESYITRFQTLTPVQSKAVAHFLSFVLYRTEHEIERYELETRERMLDLGSNEKEVETHLSLHRNKYLFESDAQIALNRYWKQFLPASPD